MRRRLKLRGHLELNRNRGCEILPKFCGNCEEISPATYFIVIADYQNANTEPIYQMISRYDALSYLINYLNSKNFYRRIGDFKLITDHFCRGLISSSLNTTEPSNQLLAVDLLHIICRNICHTLNKIGYNEWIIFAFENVIKEAAFPLLTIISTPNFDALTCSVSWALVNLLKSTNILAKFSGLPSCHIKWIHQLMVVEYMVEAFDIQLRPLDRLTHLLIRNAEKFNLDHLDELDFDTLFPLFMLFVHVPLTYNFVSTYYHRLQKHFVQISQFMSNLITHIPAKCPLFIEIVAVSVLPVFHVYTRALKNLPNTVTVDVLSNLCQFLVALESIHFPPHESMVVIACFTSALGVLSSQASSLISEQSEEFQTMCLNAFICGVIALRKRLDWSTFGGRILSNLQIFITHLNCEFSRGIIETILECITSTYGETSIVACELIGALPWKSFMEDLLLTVMGWMERIVKLYIFPEGVEVVHLADFQILLARAILSTCDSLGRDNQEVAAFCKERFKCLYLLYSDSLRDK